MTDAPIQRAIFWWCYIALLVACLISLNGCENMSVNDVPVYIQTTTDTATTTTTIPLFNNMAVKQSNGN